MANKDIGKPSKRFFAKAIPVPGHNSFRAQYAAPGLYPRMIMDGPMEKFYGTKFQAQFAAQTVLISVLQKRLENRDVRAEYKIPTAIELSEALDKADMSPQYFSWLTGAQPKRVLGWLDGSYDIPHHVFLLAKLMENEEMLQLLEEITDARTQTERPK